MRGEPCATPQACRMNTADGYKLLCMLLGIIRRIYHVDLVRVYGSLQEIGDRLRY